MKLKAAAGFALLLLALASPAEARTWRIEAGQSAALAEAFANAQAEDTIRIERGAYSLTSGLSLHAARVSVRGAGADKTMLSGAGLDIAGAGVRLEGFAIQNAQGDAIRARQCDHLEVSGVAIAWTSAAPAGASGVHVAGCGNVLVEQTSVSGASFAGIFLEGVRGAIVQQNNARGSYVGLALGNAGAVDATGNELHGNAIGAAVFDTPALAQIGGVRLFQNAIANNNGAAPGPADEAFSAIPARLGVLIMGARNVHVFDNDIGDHGSANVLIMAYPGSANGNATFNPLSRQVMIRDNRFGAVGSAPQGALASLGLGQPAPDVIWDGADTFYSPAGPRTDIPRVVMRDNQSSRGGLGAFVSLGLSAAGTPFSEADPSRAFPPLVTLAEPDRVRLN